MAFKPKTLYLIRHAESQYNAYMHSPLNWLTFRCCFDPRIYDPVLSARGELQAKRLNQKLIKENIMPKIDLVISSPLSRSIQTTLFAFPTSTSSTSSTTLSSPIRNEGTSPKLQEPLLTSTSRPETPEPIVIDELKRSSSSYSTFSSDSKETSKEKKINIEEESKEERKDKDEDTKKNEKKINVDTIKNKKNDSVPIYLSPFITEIGDTCGDIGSSVAELQKRFPALDFSTVPENWWYYLPSEGPQVSFDEPVEKVDERLQTFVKFLLSRSEQTIAVVGHSKLFKRWTRGWKLSNCGVAKFYLDSQGSLIAPSIEDKD